MEHSPVEHVRRPAVPAESPTLGFTHLQFEALLTAARESLNPCDFALVAMLGLLGLRIFEATGADIANLGEEHGHRVLRVCGKGTKIVLVPLPPAPLCGMTGPARTWTATRTTSSPPTWPPVPYRTSVTGAWPGRRSALPVSEWPLCGVAWHCRTPLRLWWCQEVSP